MHSQIASRAGSRARWLADLSAALDEAQSLLSQLVAERIWQADADQLLIRVVGLRNELPVLRRRGFLPYQPVEAPRLVQPDWRPGETRPLATARLRQRTAP